MEFYIERQCRLASWVLVCEKVKFCRSLDNLRVVNRVSVIIKYIKIAIQPNEP